MKGITNRVFEFKDKKIKEHIGDIYDYLEAKKISSLAELELAPKPVKVKKETESTSPKKENTDDKKNRERELNRIKKEIEKAEKEIATMEAEIVSIEKQMNDASFYEKPNTTDIFNKYNSLKDAHTKKMAEWELLTEQMETI